MRSNDAVLGERTSHTQSGASVRKGRRRRRQVRHALAAPRGEVWNQDVAAEVQFRLVKEPPTAWPTAAAPERSVEVAPQVAGDRRVADGRARHRHQHALDELAHHVLGERLEIGVRRLALRVTHAESLPHEST